MRHAGPTAPTYVYLAALEVGGHSLYHGAEPQGTKRGLSPNISRPSVQRQKLAIAVHVAGTERGKGDESLLYKPIPGVMEVLFGDPEDFAEVLLAVPADAVAIRRQDQEEIEPDLGEPHLSQMAIAQQPMVDPAEGAADQADARAIRNDFATSQHGL